MRRTVDAIDVQFDSGDHRTIARPSPRPLRTNDSAHEGGALAEAGDRIEALALVHGVGAGVGGLIDAGQSERETFDRAASARL